MELAEDVAGTKYVTVGTSFAGIRKRYFGGDSRYGLAIAVVCWSVVNSHCERALVGASSSGIDLELCCRTQIPSVPVPVKYRLEPRPMCSHRLRGAVDRTKT